MFSLRRPLGILFLALLFHSTYSQDFSSMAGDWVRVNTEYQDGGQLPPNHNLRMYVRYYFTKKDAYVILGGSGMVTNYSRQGNVLKIGPVQVFGIEQYDDKSLTLLEGNGNDGIRYRLIPTDSFQTITRRYAYEVVNADTIYENATGIEPLYIKGQNEFMADLMRGFSQNVGFNFSYVVRKDGTIGDVTIHASTNPKMDKRLVQLLKKTSGNWIAGTYKRNPINVRLKGNVGFTR